MALRQFRPRNINLLDKEMEVKVDDYNERVLNWVDQVGCTYIRSLDLPSNVEQTIISNLRQDVVNRTNKFSLNSENQDLFRNDVFDLISHHAAVARYEAAILLAEAIIKVDLIISDGRLNYIRSLVRNMAGCTDDEIINRLNFFATFTYYFKVEQAVTFIKAKGFPLNIENELIFSLKYKIKLKVLVHLLSSSL